MFKFSNRLKCCLYSFKLYENLFKRSLGGNAVLCRHPNLTERSQLIDGKSLSLKILDKLKLDVNKWIGLGNRKPHLSVILIGDDPASKLYVKNKFKAAKSCGIKSDVIHCPTTITQKELHMIISDLNSDDSVDAILVQLPCPEHINEKALFDSIIKYKDVDGFNSINIANFTLHENDGIIPCTALAVREILTEIGSSYQGLEGVVIGCSKYIGLPIFLMLSSPSQCGLAMTTTVCNIHTPQSTLEHFLQRSDVIVSAVGKPGLIKGEFIKPGAIVIDVGISVVEEPGSKLHVLGDVEFEKARDKASYITPVPGGVGPVTVAMLLRNTLQCAVLCKKRKLELEQANNRTED